LIIAFVAYLAVSQRDIEHKPPQTNNKGGYS